MAMLCWLVYAGTPTSKVVGLCHSVQNTTRDLAELVGVPYDEVTYLSAGINHQAFILRFERDGEDLYPLLDERLAADPDLQRRVRVAVYRGSGTSRRSRASTRPSTCPWFMRHDDELERFRIPVGEYIRRSEDNLVEFERVKAEARRAASGCRSTRSSEYAAAIIHSIETGEPSVIYGNVRNTGLIAGLPDRRVRRGAVPGRRSRRPGDRRCRTTHRSSPRSTARS